MSGEDREWEVEQILQRGRFSNITHYLVHWRGYEESEATWEPITNLENCEDAIMQFENTILNRTRGASEGKRKRGRKSNRELAEERERTDEQISEDGKSVRNREEVSTNESQPRKGVQRGVVDEGGAVSQEMLRKHMQIEARSEGKAVQKLLKLTEDAEQETQQTIKSLKRDRRNDNNESKNEEMQPEIKPRKKFRTDEDEAEPERKKPTSTKKLKQQAKEPIKESRAEQESEIAKEYLHKMAEQNAQMELIKQMLGSIKKREQTNQQEPRDFKSTKQEPSELCRPIPIAEPIQPSLTFTTPPSPKPQPQQEKPSKPATKSVKFTMEALCEPNLQRYYRCEQQHLSQKRTMLLNISRKDQGGELRRHKTRTIELPDETLIHEELKGLPRVKSEVEVERVELLIRLPYGWSAICRNKQQGLFLADVNLIQQEYWQAIEQKYFTR